MSRILLITRPRYDETTHYLFHWAEKIIKLADKKGIQVLDLDKDRARKKELTSMVAKKQPSFIFFNGHGNSNCIAGQHGEVLVKEGENEELLRSRVIYALSCKSAKKLGPKSIKIGAVVYLGYKDVFIFAYSQEKITRPLEDKIAGLFLEPSNKLVTSLLKGHSAEKAYNYSKNLFIQNMQELLTSNSSNTDIIPWLIWDMKNQVCLGNGNATF